MGTMADKLTAKQRKFIDEYFACGMNASLAARRAGYKTRQSASENMANPVIRAEIDRIYREYTMPASEVLARLSEQARADIADITNKEGLLNMRKARALGKTGVIKRIKQTTITRDDEETHIIEVELHDPQKALQLLGKYHALFTEKLEHSGSITITYEDKAVALIRDGKLDYPKALEVFDGKDDLVRQLFARANVAVTVR
jgi:phage terminase small subunit